MEKNGVYLLKFTGSLDSCVGGSFFFFDLE